MYIYIYMLQEFNQRAIRVAFAELRLVLPLGICYPLWATILDCFSSYFQANPDEQYSDDVYFDVYNPLVGAKHFDHQQRAHQNKPHYKRSRQHVFI